MTGLHDAIVCLDVDLVDPRISLVHAGLFPEL